MMYKKSLQTVLLVLVFLLAGLSGAGAVDIAPRISDREIIEKLSTLEAGQKALDQRLTDLRSEMKTGYDALGKRIDDLALAMYAMFSAIVGLMIALFAYIAWDRRTMLKPVVSRIDNLEREVINDLDLRHIKGSLLSRQLKALREYAQDDQKLTEILRSLSLL